MFAQVVCGVIVGLLLGWTTLEATYRARRKLSAWFREKMGFKSKEEAPTNVQSPVSIMPSDSAVWSAQEKGYSTPGANHRVREILSVVCEN